mmetsp:Transcript_159190/g.305402  ORF Transcript_159190/g.305402 Transcript_159190/m.305402 type:complete len:329 (-) Transcript_159190:334-1320(-)
MVQVEKRMGHQYWSVNFKVQLGAQRLRNEFQKLHTLLGCASSLLSNSMLCISLDTHRQGSRDAVGAEVPAQCRHLGSLLAGNDLQARHRRRDAAHEEAGEEEEDEESRNSKGALALVFGREVSLSRNEGKRPMERPYVALPQGSMTNSLRRHPASGTARKLVPVETHKVPEACNHMRHHKKHCNTFGNVSYEDELLGEHVLRNRILNHLGLCKAQQLHCAEQSRPSECASTLVGYSCPIYRGAGEVKKKPSPGVACCHLRGAKYNASLVVKSTSQERADDVSGPEEADEPRNADHERMIWDVKEVQRDHHDIVHDEHQSDTLPHKVFC